MINNGKLYRFKKDMHSVYRDLHLYPGFYIEEARDKHDSVRLTTKDGRPVTLFEGGTNVWSKPFVEHNVVEDHRDFENKLEDLLK